MSTKDFKSIEIIEEKSILLQDYTPEERLVILKSLADNDNMPIWRIKELAESYEYQLQESMYESKPDLKESILRKLFLIGLIQAVISFDNSIPGGIIMSFDKPITAWIVNSSIISDQTVIPVSTEINVIGYTNPVSSNVDFIKPVMQPLPDEKWISQTFDEWLIKKQNERSIVRSVDSYIIEDKLPKTPQLKYSQIEFAKRLNTIFGPKEIPELNDIVSQKLLEIYIDMEDLGPDAKEVKDKIRALNAEKEKITTIMKLEYIKRQETLVHNKFRKMILARLGNNKLKSIDAEAANQQLRGEQMLTLIPPADAKSIRKEYYSREELMKSIMNNSCDHVGVLNKYFKTVKRTNIYSDFNKLLKPDFAQPIECKSALESQRFINCSVCTLPMICPHYEVMSRDYQLRDLKTALEPIIDISGYCSICGAKLPSFESSQTVYSMYMDPEIKDIITSEIGQTMRYFNLPPVINVGRFIGELRESIYDPISELRNSINRSKTSSVNDIRSKIRYYTSLYVFAHFIKLVVSGKGFSIKEREHRNNDRVVSDDSSIESMIVPISGGNDSSNPAKILTTALKLFISSKNILLNELQYSAEQVKTTLINVYKTVVVGNISSEKTNSEKLVFNKISNSVIYDILLHIDYQTKPPKSASEPALRMDYLLGQTIKEISKHTKSYWEKIKIPNGLPDYMKLLLENAKSNVHMLSMFKGGELTPEWTKIRSDIQKIKNIDCEIIRKTKISRMKPWFQLGTLSKQDYRTYAKIVPLHQVYDEFGEFHKFDIYIIDDKEYSLKDVPQFDKFKSFKSRKCSICGYVRDNQNESSTLLPDDTINQRLDILAEAGKIYSFFNIICPASDDESVHTFDNDGIVCTKCSYSNKPNKSIMTKFANSYRTQYKKVSSEQSTGKMIIMTTDSTIQRIDISSYRHEFSIIDKLASTYAVPITMITSIGSIEKQQFSGVEDGTFINPDEEKFENSRMLSLLSYVRMIIIEYNIMKFYHKNPIPTKRLTELLTSSGFPISATIQLTSLPEINFVFYPSIIKPNEANDLLLETLARLLIYFYEWTPELQCPLPTGDVIVNMNASFPKETKTLLRSLGTRLFTNILKMEKQFAKPQLFIKASMYKFEEYTDGSSGNDYDDIDDTDDIRMNKKMMNVDTTVEDEPVDQFDVSAFDVEDEEDLNLHVGDSIGL